MCQLRNMGLNFVPHILSFLEVDGNMITAHVARVIKQDMEIRML